MIKKVNIGGNTNIIPIEVLIMTEKRFKLTHLNHIDVKGIENLLNDLNDELEEVKKENEQFKKIIQKYYDTTNDEGKQLISDLVDCFEMKGLDVAWMNKEW